MSGGEPAVVAFPVAADGRRSTSALGRAVVADALGGVDPAGARSAEREGNWRTGYLAHFRRLIEAGLVSRQAAVAVARGGLESLHRRMRVVGPDGAETGLGALVSAPARGLAAVTVAGTGTADGELAVPYRGERLAGDALLRRLEAWVADGVIEPSCAEAVRLVAANPRWLALPGRTIAVLGAGAEVGPLPVLLSWGARVIGIDLARPAIWERVLGQARRGAGTLLVPVADCEPGPGQSGMSEANLACRAGLDLTRDVPAVADWLACVDGPLVLGNYVYADGGDNVRVSAAVDALTVRVQAARGDVALAGLATPTDVFAVPADAVAQATRAYRDRPRPARLGRWPLQALSGGRLLRRAYPPGADPGVFDGLVTRQGPNYALAKRVQRWRATVARDDGAAVSMNVAPPTRTRSVLKNRALAAAYAGAHRFGVEVFEPVTCRTLMAALLVHDLQAGGGMRQDHPWQDEARAAAHGGLWRIAYAPRSAFGLAALLGYAAARNGALPSRARDLSASGLPSDLSRYIVEHIRGFPVLATEGTMADGFNVRVGDADREAIAAQLREHYADGRLTFDELNERLDQTFAAKTKADLDVVMRDLPHVARPFTGAPSGGSSQTPWQEPTWQGPAGPPGSGWDYHSGNGRRGRPSAAFAPLLGLMWLCLIIGAVMLFGLGGGDRPLAIVLIVAALAFLKRLFGLGGRRRGPGGPRGPRRGPRPRGPFF